MQRRLTLAAVVATVGVLVLAAGAPAHGRAAAPKASPAATTSGVAKASPAATRSGVAKASPAATKFGVKNGCMTPLGVKPCWVAGVYNDDYTGMDDPNYKGPPAQASGRHPFVGVTDFIVANQGGDPNGTVKTIRVDTPPGLVSNPQATPKCSPSHLATATCPNDTQLGIVKLRAYAAGVTTYVGESVYNLAPSASHCAGSTADYAFDILLLAQRVDVCGSVRKNPPYNLYFTIQVPSGSALVRSTLIFWGVPGDSGHNPQRGWFCASFTKPCVPPAAKPSQPHGKAFLTNPTGCVPAGQVSTLRLTSTAKQTARARSKTPVPAIGCRKLRFAPKVALALGGHAQTTVGKHPALTATVGQSAGQANIESSTVTLPLSLALDPKNSQHVCSVKGARADKCPASTIVGSARAKTPLLSSPLTGKVYLVQGIRYVHGHRVRTFPAMLVALRGKAAIDLHAQTSVNKRSQLVTTFSALPDLPVSSFTLKISGGKRGILVVSKNLCRHAQRAGVVFTGQNGATTRTTVVMGRKCKSG